MSHSTISISGTVSKEPEQRFTNNNKSIINLMIQTLRYDGRSKEEKSYPIKINLWGDTFSELLGEFQIGDRVLVSGRLQIEQFNDKEGKQVRLASVDASRIVKINDLAESKISDFSSMSNPSSEMKELESEEIPF